MHVPPFVRFFPSGIAILAIVVAGFSLAAPSAEAGYSSSYAYRSTSLRSTDPCNPRSRVKMPCIRSQGRTTRITLPPAGRSCYPYCRTTRVNYAR